jgi:hypothetical protein
MTSSIRLRRAIVATLILTAIFSSAPLTGAHALVTEENAYTYTSDRICDIPWRDGPKQVKRLIRCASTHWGVSGRKALAIAYRESHYNPRAYNSGSCAKGIFQHLCRYWPGRAVTFGFKGHSAFDGRANIIVTIKMVKRHGWAPWGG